MTDEHATAEISEPAAQKRFVLAGNAVFTVTNPTTGNRFTFRVRAKDVDDDRTLHFVQVLTGPSNTSDYTFLGTIFDDGNFVHSRKSPIGRDAMSAKAFRFVWQRLSAERELPVTFHHEGRCGACGRPLTVPESIESGLGPVCAGR